MAVINVFNPEDFPYRQTTDSRGRSSYQMRWVVDTDDPTMPSGLVSIGAQEQNPSFDTFVPPIWSTYSFNGHVDEYAYLKGGLALYKPTPTEKPTRWYLEGTYEPLDPSQTPESSISNPVLRPVVYRTEGIPYTWVPDLDNSNEPIANAAGDVFTDRKPEEGFYDSLTAVKNYATLNEIISLNSTYRYSVNSDTFYGAPPRTAKIDAIESGELITEGNFSYYSAIIRVVFNYDTWDIKYVNQGYYYLDNDKRKRATDEQKRPTVAPILLAQDGTKLPDGQIGNFVSFRMRREVSYAGLGI